MIRKCNCASQDMGYHRDDCAHFDVYGNKKLDLCSLSDFLKNKGVIVDYDSPKRDILFYTHKLAIEKGLGSGVIERVHRLNSLEELSVILAISSAKFKHLQDKFVEWKNQQRAASCSYDFFSAYTLDTGGFFIFEDQIINFIEKEASFISPPYYSFFVNFIKANDPSRDISKNSWAYLFARKWSISTKAANDVFISINSWYKVSEQRSQHLKTSQSLYSQAYVENKFPSDLKTIILPFK